MRRGGRSAARGAGASVCRENSEISLRCLGPPLGVGLQARRPDSALLGVPSAVRVLTKPVAVQGAGEMLAAPNIRLGAAGTAEAATPDGFQDRAAVLVKFRGRHDVLKRMDFAITYLSQDVSRWLLAVAIHPERARLRSTKTHSKGRVVAAAQAVSTHGRQRSRRVSAISAIRIRSLDLLALRD